jgi:2-oxoisovalerate dehydrogenase E1 component beta subunit
MNNITMVKAINLALEKELEFDAKVILFGEDIGVNGGVFRTTEKLQQKFGSKRVLDTPLAESLIAGLALGMSSYGLKPVAEFQFMGFIYPAVEQIFCHISRMRYRTKGKTTCPLVLRAPYAGGINAPEHHSESTEAIFAHIPGIRVISPSNPQNAYSLLRSAIQHPDPVIFLEPKRIYNNIIQTVDEKLLNMPIDKCQTIFHGTDLTVISWGAMLPTVIEAIQNIKENLKISINLIDLVSIKPIDAQTIIDSVNITGRCLIIQEAAKSCGLAAEISAIVNETSWHSLLAPVTRLTGYDTIMPQAKLEKYYIPNKNQIYSAICELMEQ